MKEDIDEESKILNFMAMTETGDPDVARKYLETSNWDETTAVNNFFSKIKVGNTDNNNNNNINITNINEINNNINIINEPINNNNNILNQRLINNNDNTKKDEGFISKYIFGPFKSLMGLCTEKRDVDLEEEKRIFHLLPNKIQDSTQFCQFITRKIGVIIFYNVTNIENLTRLITQISRNTMIMNIIKKYFGFYPLLSNINEGYRMQNVISDDQLTYPSFVFCLNRIINRRGDYLDYIFDREYVLKIIQGDNITIENFNNTILESLGKLGINFDNDLGAMSDGEILEKQKSDMEALEKEAQKKEEEFKKNKILEEKKQKEEEIKIEKYQNLINEAKNKLVDEPAEDQPDVTTICFRYPDGSKNIKRRFLKSHTIQNLYDYITSLGREIYTEEENNNFSLFQPFPPKKYDNMDNTLEKEGLFPNAIVQIKEE